MGSWMGLALTLGGTGGGGGLTLVVVRARVKTVKLAVLWRWPSGLLAVESLLDLYCHWFPGIDLEAT